MFELSPFGIVIPEWIIATATLALWIGLIGVVFRFVLRSAKA